MGEEKKLGLLKAKAWYRFLKVVYIFALIVVSGFSILIINSFNESAPKIVDNDQATIVCNYGNKRTFVASQNNFKFDSTEFEPGSFLTDEHRVGLQEMCQISQQELDKKLNDIFNGKDDGKKLFDVNSVFKTEDKTSYILVHSIITLCIIFIIFEIIKRSFYYIVLGKIFPKP